jgi:hypothetical protein
VVRNGMAVAVAGILLATATSAEPGSPASEFRPATRSTLVSYDRPRFFQAQARRGAVSETLLVRHDSAGVPTFVATVGKHAGADGRVLVPVQFIRARNGAALDVLALEHLYGIVLRHDARGRYCLTIGTRSCDASRQSMSHDELLRRLIAERRRSVAAVLDRSFSMKAWTPVAMGAVGTASPDANDVAVHVSSAGKPVSSHAVYFSRAPHSSCTAMTNERGVASCRLVDQHADEGEHEDEDEQAQVVVTFPGALRGVEVLPPTTFVLAARKER